MIKIDHRDWDCEISEFGHELEKSTDNGENVIRG